MEKSFFDTHIKNREEAYQKIVEMGRNSDYITCNLLDYQHFLDNHNLISIDLSKKIELQKPDLTTN